MKALEPLDCLYRFEERKRQKEDASVPDRPNEECWPDNDFSIVSPKRRIGKKTGSAIAIVFIGAPERIGEETFLPVHDDSKDHPAGKGKCDSYGQARLRAHPECPNEAEDVQRIPADGIRTLT